MSPQQRKPFPEPKHGSRSACSSPYHLQLHNSLPKHKVQKWLKWPQPPRAHNNGCGAPFTLRDSRSIDRDGTDCVCVFGNVCFWSAEQQSIYSYGSFGLPMAVDGSLLCVAGWAEGRRRQWDVIVLFVFVNESYYRNSNCLIEIVNFVVRVWVIFH